MGSQGRIVGNQGSLEDAEEHLDWEEAGQERTPQVGGTGLPAWKVG